jgi:hypothetical protein
MTITWQHDWVAGQPQRSRRESGVIGTRLSQGRPKELKNNYPKFRRQVGLLSLPGVSGLSRNSLSENTLMPFHHSTAVFRIIPYPLNGR